MYYSETTWKTRRLFVFLWVIVLVGIAQGCKKEESENSKINDWILENMQDYYFWNTQIPARTNKTLYPKDYFESLLYKKEDRFSWIQDNFKELQDYLSGITTEAGYEFNLYLLEKGKNLVVGCIVYIKPGTPAEQAGLKRGDFFTSINGTAMTTENYQDLLSKISQPHTIGKIDLLTGQTTTVSLSVIEYAENPVLLDTIYHIESKKIGYLVYNLFARDSNQDGITYEKELNNLFGNFQTQGIQELIVDLRYNSGGSVVTAITLASMISNRTSTDIFGYQKYNSNLDQALSDYYGKDYNVNYFFDNIERSDNNNKVVESVKINKLTNLSKVYFIVSGRTASASELVINCLKPYMNVVLVGDTTLGKNVGSITIYEEDEEKQKTNKWGMQPIVLKLENKIHFSDYGNGFPPDVLADEFDSASKMRELGDINEMMLSVALNHIFGRTTLQRSSVATKTKMIGSSGDRLPVRNSMYLDSHFQTKIRR